MTTSKRALSALATTMQLSLVLLLMTTNGSAEAHERVGMSDGDAGRGEIPDDHNRPGEKADWLINELGYVEDRTTVRESIHLTDHRVRDLEEKVERLSPMAALIGNPYVVALVVAGLVGLIGLVLRVYFLVARLQGYVAKLESDG